MDNEIEKTEPSPDDVLAAITSFNDPAIITNIFRELGWTYSFEIKEWLTMARQNANLSVKSKALIQLRTLLREAAEASGYVANVSTTAPNAHGGHTTFSAKRISGILNPVKKIESTEIKESQNDKTEERTESNRGSDRGQSDEKSSKENLPRNNEGFRNSNGFSEQDTRRAFPIGDVVIGGTATPDGEETPGRTGGGVSNRDAPSEHSDSPAGDDNNPCIKTRPPSAGKGDLFPGVASAGDS